MRVRIFQPFVKVWTPRVPDSDYSSLAPFAPPSPIVIVPLISEPSTTGTFLHAGSYSASLVPSSLTNTLGHGVFLEAGTYT